MMIGLRNSRGGTGRPRGFLPQPCMKSAPGQSIIRPLALRDLLRRTGAAIATAPCKEAKGDRGVADRFAQALQATAIMASISLPDVLTAFLNRDRPHNLHSWSGDNG